MSCGRYKCVLRCPAVFRHTAEHYHRLERKQTATSLNSAHSPLRSRSATSLWPSLRSAIQLRSHFRSAPLRYKVTNGRLSNIYIFTYCLFRNLITPVLDVTSCQGDVNAATSYLINWSIDCIVSEEIFQFCEFLKDGIDIWNRCESGEQRFTTRTS